MKFLFYFLIVILFIGFSFSLKISEVYFDGHDEYIGIYNDSDKNVNLDIIVSGAKASNFMKNINIEAKSEIIIGDDDISDFFSGEIFYDDSLTLSISDTKDIDIQILSGNTILDSFFVESSKVSDFNDTNKAFHKIFSGDIELIEIVKKSINMNNGFYGNPSYVEKIGNNNQKNENQDFTGNSVLNCNLSLQKQNNEYILNYTGNFQYSDISWYLNNDFETDDQIFSFVPEGQVYDIKGVGKKDDIICTGNFFLINNQESVFDGTIKVNEINAGTDNFPEYVELKSFGNFSGNLMLEGFGYGNNILNINLKTYSGDIILVGEDKSNFIDKSNFNSLDGLSLSNKGGNLIIRHNGQVLDSVYYKNEDTIYFGGLSGDLRVFNKLGENTPGYKNFIKDYYKTKNSCKIVMQSYSSNENGIKINFDSEVSDNSFCDENYYQMWTYSGSINTGTCNPYSMDIPFGLKNVEFEIKDKNGKKICYDDYEIFSYNKEELKENKNINLNCSIKIQSKDDYFFDDNSINFITIINGKEIQNSNSNYVCEYFLNGSSFSNKCNPYSYSILNGLNKIDLEVVSKSGQTCHTSFDLNLPENLIKNEKIIEEFNSDEFKELIEDIEDKYKTEYTLKKVFDPISFLYEEDSQKDSKDELKNCSKFNSDELRELVIKINEKYKTEYTLKKVFDPINYLYLEEIDKESTFNYTGSLFIKSLVPNPNGRDSGKEKVVINGDFITGNVYFGKKSKKLLTGYYLSGNDYIFTGSFGLTNKGKCVNLYVKDKIIDKVCYVNAENDEEIKDFIVPNGEIQFKGEYIIFKGEIIKNKPFIKLFGKIEKIKKVVFEKFEELLKENEHFKKKYDKTYKLLLKRLVQYTEYKNKYRRMKKELTEKNSDKYKRIIEKNKEIRNLNNIRIFLKSFIVYVKEYIPKDKYRQYLDGYKKAKEGEKIRF